ncbi:MAG: hypothetical protein HY260_04905 [Chloroflexi bacterium]|nr:hypothetical protein [Chloroflexota bacterium]
MWKLLSKALIGMTVAAFGFANIAFAAGPASVAQEGNRTHYKGNGQITGKGEDDFDFLNLRGKSWEFYVDTNTVITRGRTGETLSFSDLTVGMYAHVVAEKRDDGKWWATEIRVLPKRIKPSTAPTP